MIVGELITMAEQRLGSVRQDGKFDRRLIKANLSRAYDQLLHDTFNRRLMNIDSFSKEFGNPTPISISKDVVTNEYSSDLPAEVIQLPNRSTGVTNITNIQGDGVDFVLVTDNNSRYFSSMEVSEIDSTIWYTIRGSKVVYTKGMTPSIEAAGVRMSLIVPLKSYLDTEAIYLPMGKEVDIVNATVEFMLGTENINTKVNKA